MTKKLTILLIGIVLFSSAMPFATAKEATIKSLPLFEYHATTEPAGDVLAILLSGDGGWAEIDQEVSSALQKKGISVVGWNSQKYFWKSKTPDEAANACATIIRHYSKEWKTSRVLIIGFSYGGDLMPFIVNRLPAELKAQVKLVVLLSPSEKTDFEFHMASLTGIGTAPSPYAVIPEIKELKSAPVIAVFGEEEDNHVPNLLIKNKIKVVRIPGSHHFGRKYEDITQLILDEWKQAGLKLP